MTRTEFRAISRYARLALKPGDVQYLGEFSAQRLEDGRARFFRSYGPGFVLSFIIGAARDSVSIRHAALSMVRRAPRVPLPR